MLRCPQIQQKINRVDPSTAERNRKAQSIDLNRKGEWGELGRGRSETTSVSDQPIGETTSFSHVSARK